MPATRLSRRVWARLAQAEVCEPNPHYRDDLQIAKLTVLYAANGAAVLCSAHVLASYAVLGLHPEKVWPAIQARREALGPLSAPSVPKKAAQSVKLWFEQTNGARAINSRAAMQQGSPRTAISVPMAAPSINAAYPNSEHAGRTKERPFFKREEIQEFFETCPSELIPHPELRTVHGMWNAAGKPFGSEIQFFKAIKHYCQGAPHGGYKSESTVRSNVRRAEDRGLIEVAYRDRRGNCHHIWIRERNQSDRGLYRRVTTHRLSIPLLLKWRHLKASQAKVEPIRKPAQPDTAPKPPATAAPKPERMKPAAEHPEHRSTAPRLTSRQRTILAQRIKAYEQGVTRLEPTPARVGMNLELRPGDAAYVKPLPREVAILAGCSSMAKGDDARSFMPMGCSVQRALEAAKEIESGFESDEGGVP